MPNLIFSLCSVTVMIPIISELLLSDAKFDKKGVLQMYAPFVVMPLFIAVKTWLCDLQSPQNHAKTL